MKKALLSLLTFSTLSFSFSHTAWANFTNSKSVAISGEVRATDSCDVKVPASIKLPNITDIAVFNENGIVTNSRAENIQITLSDCNFNLQSLKIKVKGNGEANLTNNHQTDSEKARNVSIALIESGNPLNMSDDKEYNIYIDPFNKKNTNVYFHVNYIKLNKDEDIRAGMISSTMTFDIDTTKVVN